jgi:hypothetical protein
MLPDLLYLAWFHILVITKSIVSGGLRRNNSDEHDERSAGALQIQSVELSRTELWGLNGGLLDETRGKRLAWTQRGGGSDHLPTWKGDIPCLATGIDGSGAPKRGFETGASCDPDEG